MIDSAGIRQRRRHSLKSEAECRFLVAPIEKHRDSLGMTISFEFATCCQASWAPWASWTRTSPKSAACDSIWARSPTTTMRAFGESK